MARCKRLFGVQTYPVDSSGLLVLEIGRDTVEFTLRVIDSAGAGAGCTIARDDQPNSAFRLLDGETYREDRMVLDDGLTLRLEAMQVGDEVQVVTWDQ